MNDGRHVEEADCGVFAGVLSCPGLTLAQAFLISYMR